MRLNWERIELSTFTFEPSKWLHFRDVQAIEKVRKIKRKDIEKHSNPDYRIRVVGNADLGWIWVTDMFYRIQAAAQAGEPCVLILPNPAHDYRNLAALINRFEVNCQNLHIFAMDEFADQDGNTAPEDGPQGFMHQLKKYLYFEIDEKLRPAEEQIHAPQTKIIDDYGKMLTDLGGADACYSGPGWTGHLAFIEPDAEFATDDIDEFLQMGSRIVTLSPFTVAQNSLHGSFGMSGDMAAVPPRAATIGPAQVRQAKYRMDMNAIGTAGTFVAWQRIATRLACHGPVTPKVPSSILQTMKTDVFITENIAADIEPIWDQGY